MSNTDNTKRNIGHIKIINDVATSDFQARNKKHYCLVALLIGFYVCPLLAAPVALLLQSGVAVMFVLLVTIIIYVVACRKIITGKLDKQKNAITNIDQQEFDEKDLLKLKVLLKKYGPISMSSCNGFILEPNEMLKIQTIPLHGVITNPEVDKYDFIRSPIDAEDLTTKEKNLVLNAFGYKKDDFIIWFSQKDIAPWTALSTVWAISFKDANGNKKYFGHTKYSQFYNHRDLLVENDECVIHLRDEQI